MVYAILISVPLLDLLFSIWAWWRAGKLPKAAYWRGAVVAFFILMISHYVWMLLQRRSHLDTGPPALTMGMAYIWHLLLLPVLTLLICSAELVISSIRLGKRWTQKSLAPLPSREVTTSAPAALTRRQFLTIAAVSGPPALTLATGIIGSRQTQTFRVRKIDVGYPNLPPELEGVTIAHLSDVHAGKFTDEKLMAKMAAATNDLRTDLILMTGDLIDFALNDLPNATDAMRKLDCPGGVYLCEGNHDLFQDRTAFETGIRQAGLDLLINQSRQLQLRGRDIQVSGLRWGTPGNVHNHAKDGGASVNIDTITQNHNPEAFSILLAHHPHAFDAAAKSGIDLTLSGHTHGGQLNLTKHLGMGPLMYKYWSGLYKQNNSRLVVSNGVGNWLPLRINAPAEIVHLTLHRQA